MATSAKESNRCKELSFDGKHITTEKIRAQLQRQEACFSNQLVQILRVTKGTKLNTKKFGMLWTGMLKVTPTFAY